MEQSTVAVESVRNLQASGKRLLEEMLGQTLNDSQQVFIMILSPGTEPDEEAVRQARAALTEVFKKTRAHAEAHAIEQREIDAAVDEAVQNIRSRKP